MKKITIAFDDFYPSFDPNNNTIVRLLRQNYDVEVVDVTDPNNRSKVQYLFFSDHGNDFLEYDCIRIFMTGENLCPNFNLCDYAIGFEHMDFGDRFYRFPLYLWDDYRDDYDLILGDRSALYGEEPLKRDFCGIVVSNNLFSDPHREDFFYALSEYKRVDSGGRAFNNIGEPDGVPDKKAFLKKYKFSIAFENSSYPGYLTEKLLQAYSSGTVPIYWGDKKADETFNPDSFINCTGLTLDEAVAKVKEIDGDDEAYGRMITAPILVDADHKSKMEKGLETFLKNICDQSIEDAIRIPRKGKMSVYEQNYHKKAIMEKKIKKFKWLYSFPHKFL